MSPTGCPDGIPDNGSPTAGARAMRRVVGLATWRNPAGPLRGEIHRVPAWSRAVSMAMVRSPRKSTMPPRRFAGSSMPTIRRAWARTPARC
jgi:hypothetical protein